MAVRWKGYSDASRDREVAFFRNGCRLGTVTAAFAPVTLGSKFNWSKKRAYESNEWKVFLRDALWGTAKYTSPFGQSAGIDLPGGIRLALPLRNEIALDALPMLFYLFSGIALVRFLRGLPRSPCFWNRNFVIPESVQPHLTSKDEQELYFLFILFFRILVHGADFD